MEKVGTGEILALASYPTFNLSTYRQDFNTLANEELNPGRPLVNRATQGAYAPGSTLKPLTAVAALEEGVTTTTEKIKDTGKWYYPGYPQSYTYCWNRSGHGWMNVTSAITNSCNYYFATMGYRLGMDTLREYLTAFGLGESTGIEIGRQGRVPCRKTPPARIWPPGPHTARPTSSIPRCSWPTIFPPWSPAASAASPTCSRPSSPMTAPRFWPWATPIRFPPSPCGIPRCRP